MNSERLQNKGSEPAEQGLSTLLRLGLGAGGRPVDELIDRLDAPDARAWLARAALLPPLNIIVAPSFEALKPLSRESIEEAKTLSKGLLAPGVPHDDRLRGILTYFLALVAGKLQHGRWFSSQPSEQILRDVADLVTVLPEALHDSLWRVAR